MCRRRSTGLYQYWCYVLGLRVISQMFYSKEKPLLNWHRRAMALVELVRFRDLCMSLDQKDTGNDGLFYRIILSLYRELSFFPNCRSLPTGLLQSPVHYHEVIALKITLGCYQMLSPRAAASVYHVLSHDFSKPWCFLYT